MPNLHLSEKIAECHANDWDELLSKLDSIIQSLVDNPSCGNQIKTALVYWSDAVDCKIAGLPPSEQELILHNPAMNMRDVFGTEV